MCFGDSVMHSGRGRFRDRGDTAYLRCCQKTSATDSPNSEKCKMFRWPRESGGKSRAIATRCRLPVIVQLAGYRSCYRNVKKYVTDL